MNFGLRQLSPKEKVVVPVADGAPKLNTADASSVLSAPSAALLVSGAFVSSVVRVDPPKWKAVAGPSAPAPTVDSTRAAAESPSSVKLNASDEAEDLALNIWIVVTSWFSFLHCNLMAGDTQDISQEMLLSGIYQVFSLERPYITKEHKDEVLAAQREFLTRPAWLKI